MPRLDPLEPPYEPGVARTLERLMPPGAEPLRLFRTIAHNGNVLDKFRSAGAYFLNFGTIDPREREIVIHRTAARCGAEYEWGVHAAIFARQVGLTEEQLRATAHGAADDPSWSERDRTLVRLADELHETGTVSEPLWRELASGWTEEQIVELVALGGYYHLVSFLANALGVEHEDWAERYRSSTLPS